MRLIDADALYEAVSEHITTVSVYPTADWARGRNQMKVICLEEIANAPTVATDTNVLGKWISVKDRLPEGQIPVLVYVPPYSDEDEEYIGHVAVSYYTQSAQGGYWAGTDGNVYGAIGIIHEPSHWMPFPEPPKEDEDAVD